MKCIKDYRYKVEEELLKICYDILIIIDEYLILLLSMGELMVFYYKMYVMFWDFVYDGMFS